MDMSRPIVAPAMATSKDGTPEPNSSAEPDLSIVYSPLLLTEIRLVEILSDDFDDPIRVNIKVVNLADQPVYDALSYVWNPRDGTMDSSESTGIVKVVNHNSLPIAIGANLEAALRHLRPNKIPSSASPGRTLWIDALCINQSDRTDRSQQVGRMKDIYSLAAHVLIWLGPVPSSSDCVVKVIRTGHLGTIDGGAFILGLRELLRRDWFRRVWVTCLMLRIMTYC